MREWHAAQTGFLRCCSNRSRTEVGTAPVSFSFSGGTFGGGAGGGAAIGGATGGGKGAGIGAAIGAGAGTAAAMLTGKRDVKFPPETLLRFALEQELTIQ